MKGLAAGTEERGAEFGHEFFDRVAFGPETLVPKSRDKRDSCAVQCVVSCARVAVVALGVAEGLEERQLDAVCRGKVKGTVAGTRSPSILMRGDQISSERDSPATAGRLNECDADGVKHSRNGEFSTGGVISGGFMTLQALPLPEEFNGDCMLRISLQ